MSALLFFALAACFAVVLWLMIRAEREIEAVREPDEPTPWQREMAERLARTRRATELYEARMRRKQALEDARREMGEAA